MILENKHENKEKRQQCCFLMNCHFYGKGKGNELNDKGFLTCYKLENNTF